MARDEPASVGFQNDALTIIFTAFDPRIELLAITTVAGNGPIEKVTENALDGAGLPSPTFTISDKRAVDLSAQLVHPRISRIANEG